MKTLLIGLTLLSSISIMASDCSVFLESKIIVGTDSAKAIAKVEKELTEKGYSVTYDQGVASYVVELEARAQRGYIQNVGIERPATGIATLIRNDGKVNIKRENNSSWSLMPRAKAQSLMVESARALPRCSEI
ncbi:MAG: hypothetical protein HON90_13325 [Halobacteriovoraceae bacterium]|jgi:hypothetical protein|nr:hypothetical protein [Halobacteriovoraceae bacterium]